MGASPDEAFVSFADEAYLPLVRVLADSVATFSTKPLVVFGINVDVPWPEHSALIRRRLDVPVADVRDLWRLKSRVILESGVGYGAYLDADCVVNRDIDLVFEWARGVVDHPLCPRHPCDPDNQRVEMRRLGVWRKSMPYVHGHVVFSETCRPFLEEWNRLMGTMGEAAPNVDETLLNVLLWKRRAKRQLPTYDPYFETVRDYIDGTPARGYGSECDVRYLVFHGCKDTAAAAAMLACLTEHAASMARR